MRKWLIAFVAGAVVVGCTGGNGGIIGGSSGTTAGTTSGSTGTTGGNSRQIATVSLPSRAAQANIVILSGQGRRSSGDNHATFNIFRWGQGQLNIVPTVFQGSLSGIDCNLGLPSMNNTVFTEDLGEGVAAKSFTTLLMEVWDYAVEDQFGNVVSQYAAHGGLPVSLPNLPINATLVAGRQTTIQTYLNDSSISMAGPNIVFDQAGWNNDNLPGGLTALPGFLSDFVSFDLTPMAPSERPNMQLGGAADKAMFTGDQTGLALGTNSVGSFDLYSTSFVESGVLTPPKVLGGAPAPGTYNVLEPDPRGTPPTAALVAAVQGIWRPYTDVLTNVPAFTMLILPTTNANGQHQVVAFNKSGTGVSALWYGTATLSGTSSGTVTLHPIKELGAPTTTATGTLGTFTVSGGIVVDGKFTMSAPPSGWPFPATGDFVVFR
ncbi:MAG: hypothetical protein JSS65_13895 [Armatimonadetes bacterium]|nr:hypothetical protein [Armatimonadota bacterium]